MVVERCNRRFGRETIHPTKKLVQQGLEIRGFWFQKKTVQLKTVLPEVYTYVLNEIFFQKTVYLQGFCSKSVFCEVTPIDQRGFLAIGTFGQLKIQLVDLFSFSNNWRQLDHLRSKNAQSKNKVYGFFRNLQGD